MGTHRQSSAASQALDKSMKAEKTTEYVYEDVDETSQRPCVSCALLDPRTNGLMEPEPSPFGAASGPWVFPQRRETNPGLSTSRSRSRKCSDEYITSPLKWLMVNVGKPESNLKDEWSREDMSSTPPPVPLLLMASTGRNGYAGPSPLSADPIRASDEVTLVVLLSTTVKSLTLCPTSPISTIQNACGCCRINLVASSTLWMIGLRHAVHRKRRITRW
jgi:hypothetical protein